MWARLVGSTVVGEVADTVLFCVIAFVGVFPTWRELVSYTVTGYVYKVAVEVIFLPVTYVVIRAIKRREPGYAPAPAVHQLRLLVAATDLDQAVRFYRDALGLAPESDRTRDGARVVVLGAGRATLELSDATSTDRVGVSGPYGVAFEVDDAARDDPAAAQCRRRCR